MNDVKSEQVLEHVSIVAQIVVEVDLELVKGDLGRLERVLATEVGVEADAALEVELEQLRRVQRVQIVDRHGHHLGRIVNALAAQEVGQIARKIQETIELIEMLCQHGSMFALEVANEKLVYFGQIAQIVDLVLIVENKRVREVLIRGVHDRNNVCSVWLCLAVCSIVVLFRVEVCVKCGEYELDGDVLEVVAH